MYLCEVFVYACVWWGEIGSVSMYVCEGALMRCEGALRRGCVCVSARVH